jgi:hypothetical protein
MLKTYPSKGWGYGRVFFSLRETQKVITVPMFGEKPKGKFNN